MTWQKYRNESISVISLAIVALSIIIYYHNAAISAINGNEKVMWLALMKTLQYKYINGVSTC